MKSILTFPYYLDLKWFHQSISLTSEGIKMPCTGKHLTKEVETQLLDDLEYHNVLVVDGLRFDWSQGLGEGKCHRHMDGCFEEDSEIYLYDADGVRRAGGWACAELDSNTGFFICYWWSLVIYDYDTGVVAKMISHKDIPPHIAEKIPDDYLKQLLAADRKIG